jgi:hypothetical protein
MPFIRIPACCGKNFSIDKSSALSAGPYRTYHTSSYQANLVLSGSSKKCVLSPPNRKLYRWMIDVAFTTKRVRRSSIPTAGEVYAWHGVRVPSYVVEHPAQISVRKINAEQNAEVRRVLLERFGFARFLHESGAQLLDEQLDNLGHPIRLYRQEIAGDEPLVMVEVTNSTPELMVQADGSNSLQFKRYTLRVPPNMVSAKEAIAWTFDLPVSLYNPEKET